MSYLLLPPGLVQASNHLESIQIQLVLCKDMDPKPNCFSFSVISSHVLGCILLVIEIDDADFVIDVVAADVTDVSGTDIVAVEVVNIIDEVVVFCTVVASVKLKDEQLRS